MSNPVSPTAFYCGGVRMVDAQNPSPVVGDRHAATLMGDDGRKIFAAFERFTNQNGSNIARHRVLDDMLRDRFKGQPLRLTVLLGAGLDSRAFRLGSGRWVELDEAPIIERKERLLPAASCPSSLTRVAIDFAKDSLEEKLAPFATTERMSVVMEGVLMYLDEPTIRRTCGVLMKLFPNHSLLCDVMSEKFFKRYGQEIHAEIERLGARFTWTPKNPVALFTSLGYREAAKVSISLRAAEYRAISTPVWRMRTFLRTLRDGYCVHAFKVD
jgi:methyltransferase (TIGR00027 family)